MLKGNHETETNHECGGAFFAIERSRNSKDKRILIGSGRIKKQLFETKVEKLPLMRIIYN